MAVRARRFLSRRARWFVFVMLVGVAVYLLAVTPGRTYIDQQRQMHAASQRLEAISAANQKLTERTTQLQSDAEIARLARERYELVPKGAQAYAVMPPPPPPAPVATENHGNKGGWSKVWDGLSFWS